MRKSGILELEEGVGGSGGVKDMFNDVWYSVGLISYLRAARRTHAFHCQAMNVITLWPGLQWVWLMAVMSMAYHICKIM